MKKLVLKTALITFGVALILIISVFGIVSVSAPYAMMNFTASLGLETISGDYAYQEYERSGDIECLTRSFLIAAVNEKYKTAAERFEKIEEERERFEAYCNEVELLDEEGIPPYAYRDYVMGRAACMKYALGEDAVTFAIAETGKDFPEGNPVAALAATAATNGDAETCSALLSAIRAAGFEENDYYNWIVTNLEGVHE